MVIISLPTIGASDGCVLEAIASVGLRSVRAAYIKANWKKRKALFVRIRYVSPDQRAELAQAVPLEATDPCSVLLLSALSASLAQAGTARDTSRRRRVRYSVGAPAHLPRRRQAIP